MSEFSTHLFGFNDTFFARKYLSMSILILSIKLLPQKLVKEKC